MMMEWPDSWLKVTSASFRLMSASQMSASPWTKRINVYGPHQQMWVAKMVLIPLSEDIPFRISAFLDRLGGMAGLIRIGDPSRRMPYFNKLQMPGSETFSDGTTFTDGTGFSAGLLPPTAFIAQAASKGEVNTIIGGLPASTIRALRAGDLFEIKVGGVATEIPHLYELVRDCGTDVSGLSGVEIRPPLRANVALGDQVVLSGARSCFRLIDENQNDISYEPMAGGAPLGSMGFSLFENLP